MRLVKMAVNATGAGVCLLLEWTGHDTGTLNTLANLSLALSIFVLIVAAIHELVQGRTELLQGTGKSRTTSSWEGADDLRLYDALSGPVANQMKSTPPVKDEERCYDCQPTLNIRKDLHIVNRR